MAEPIRSMPPSDEYQRNWERIYAPNPTYPNGCPILPDPWEYPIHSAPSGPQKDDL